MKRKQKIVLSVCGVISMSSYLQSCKTTTGASSGLLDDQYGDEKGGYVRPTAEAQRAVELLNQWIRARGLDDYVIRVMADGDSVVLDCLNHRGAQSVQDAMNLDRDRFRLSGGRWVYDVDSDPSSDDKGGGYDDDKGGDNDKGGYEDDKGGDNDKGGYDDDKGGADDGLVVIKLAVDGISYNPGENSKGGDDKGGGHEDDKGGGYGDDKGGGYEDDKGGANDDDKGGGYEDDKGGANDDDKGGGYDDDKGGGGYDDDKGGGEEDEGSGFFDG